MISLQGFIRYARLVVCLLCAILSGGCGRTVTPHSPLKVVATIAPLADWARHVGGARVEVHQIVPASIDPRTFEVTAEQRRLIQGAEVVIFNGLGLEPWIEDILSESRNTRVIVLEIAQFTGPLTERVPKTAPEPQEGDRIGAGAIAAGRGGEVEVTTAPVYSPYLWLDPRSAMGQVELIAEMFTRVDPEGVMVYRQNAARYVGDLENLDSSIFRQIDRWPRRSLAAPDRFLYPFTRHFSVAVQILDEAQHRAPETLPVVVDRLGRNAPSLEDAIEQRTVITLNPLDGETYIELMRTNVHSMTLAVMQ